MPPPPDMKEDTLDSFDAMLFGATDMLSCSCCASRTSKKISGSIMADSQMPEPSDSPEFMASNEPKRPGIMGRIFNRGAAQ